MDPKEKIKQAADAAKKSDLERKNPELVDIQEIVDERAELVKCKTLKAQSELHRRKVDWEWLVRTLYVRGYHFARYNRGTNTVVFSTRTGVRIPVNLVSAHLRGVRNQTTSFQPKWEVMPSVTTESAFENARYSGKVLDYLYEKSQIKRKIKESVTDALMYSVGVWQFDADKKGNIIVNRVDPYDFYVDPNVKSPNLNDPEYGAEFVTKSVQTAIDAIKKNKKFKHTENLHADNQPASAQYKKFLLQVTRNQFQTATEENPTVILNETWRRIRQENGDIKMRIVHWVEIVQDPLLVQEIDTDEYPFEVLQGDITPGELYGESWVKHLIPINRVIDALESHVFEYNHFFAKGRFVIDKNSGVRIIVNQHGQIIEKNRGSQVQALPIAPLPPSPQEQLANMRKYLEDISGVHDVSLGRLPGTIRSGVAIAELRQSDATNQADLVDNLEDFLSRAGRKMLKLVAENWDTTHLITVTGLGGKPDYFMAAGQNSAAGKKQSAGKNEKFRFGEMDLPLALIGTDNEVKVQVGSWLAYTKEARQEKLKELFRLGAIDQQTFLQYAEFADIDGILERTRDEALMQARRSNPNMQAQREYGITLDDESLALAENNEMADGKDQPVEPEDDHQIHLSIHKREEDNAIVRAHMDEHIKLQEWMMYMNSQPQPPMQPGEGGGQPGGSPGGNPMDAAAAAQSGLGGESTPFIRGPQIGPGVRPFIANQQSIQYQPGKPF